MDPPSPSGDNLANFDNFDHLLKLVDDDNKDNHQTTKKMDNGIEHERAEKSKFCVLISKVFTHTELRGSSAKRQTIKSWLYGIFYQFLCI